MRVIGDNVLVKLDPKITEVGKIILSTPKEEATETGVVISQGGRCKEDLKDRRVVLKKVSGTLLKVDGDPVVILQEAKILATVEGEI